MTATTGSWIVFGEPFLNIFWSIGIVQSYVTLLQNYLLQRMHQQFQNSQHSSARCFTAKYFLSWLGKSGKLQKTVVGIISLNEILIFWFHMGEWFTNLKYESPSCSWFTLINSSSSIVNVDWQTQNTWSVKMWDIFRSHYSLSCFQSYICSTSVWQMSFQCMFVMMFQNVRNCCSWCKEFVELSYIRPEITVKMWF